MDFATCNLNWYSIFFARKEWLISLEVSFYDTFTGFLGQELSQSGREAFCKTF